MFLKVIFIISFLLVYVLAFILLRPFRIHRKRKVSTISIKLSYLVYLIILLVYFFFLIFFQNERTELVNEFEDKKTLMLFLFTFFSALVSNIAIMVRRKFKKKRVQYNYFVTAMNVCLCIYFVLLLVHSDWAL